MFPGVITMTGANLKDARCMAKWTQAKAASKLGLTQAYPIDGGECHLPPNSANALIGDHFSTISIHFSDQE
jgi:hypothetical protein